jgi:serine phosphatase RsbU (regulator of sigma subunit)
MQMNSSLKFIFFVAMILVANNLSAEGGVWGAFFGDEHEFVCYTSIHRNFFLAIFGGVILAGIFAWSRFRLKSRTARELSEKNKVIEEQNKDILDSIRYASRLQQALEPDHEELKKILPDSFFFLKPRDIVGGDFYFVEEHEGKIILAAIDCTGHGVPGAFLTFIGHNALRNALEKTGTRNPTAVIDAMNTEVKKSLGQQRAQNELNDGMEVGLCIYDPAARTLNYAGAGTSLYHLRDGKITEIKAAKCSVGSIQDHVKEPPPAHLVQLNAGDSFYMSSDGIPDQFGGPDGKKFQRERMKKMLEEISAEPAMKQKVTITERVEAWMEGHQQTDDMLLVGVRVMDR